MDSLVAQGISYDDDRAYDAARSAIQLIAPGLLTVSGERVGVEADTGVAIEGKRARFFGGIAIGAELRRVSIERIQQDEQLEGIRLSTVRHDLCAVLVPDYLRPDPIDLIFMSEIYVPFSSLVGFGAEPNN